jgi:hypothetical protein
VTRPHSEQTLCSGRPLEDRRLPDIHPAGLQCRLSTQSPARKLCGFSCAASAVRLQLCGFSCAASAVRLQLCGFSCAASAVRLRTQYVISIC